MEKLVSAKKPFDKPINQEKGATWLIPKLICEVYYHEFTKTGSLRHPVFKGFRDDKHLTNITMEEKVENNETEKDFVFGKKKVHLSNLNKIYWPEEKITKSELLAYYEQMADHILPYLKDKPLSLNRHPNGINAPSFYQKNIDVDNLPKWAKTVKVHSDSTDKDINYLICNDKATLLYAVNLGCIEINPWLSTYKKPENPEYLVIDLDPDGNDFLEVINIALLFKKTFDELGIKSFVKTSGSSGIHIYVYIGAKYNYDFVKDFAEFVAQLVHEKSPDNTSIERSLSKRNNLIYLDFLQNRRGQTIACPFSVRPKSGATVSMLLSWDMLNESLDMKDYTIRSVPELVKNFNNPWKEIGDKIADLEKALKMLKK